MKELVFNSEFFDISATLNCGQIFRFQPFEKGFLVFSLDKCAYAYTEGQKTVISCENQDENYFKNFFDVERDYSKIVSSALSINAFLGRCALAGKGIRILNQNKEETLFSFIISQNNNIPRIKSIIEKLCLNLGEQKAFNNLTYHAFPTAEKMAEKSIDFYKSIGLGYRAEYIKNLAELIANGLNVEDFAKLSTQELRKSLIKLYGVGPKVADCVSLFGYHRSQSFPVDTWIEKVYRENFFGLEKNREKITEYFNKTFGENAGYFQQYMFYYKRSLEKSD